MKTILLLIISFLAINFANAQYATNFNCADCSSINHELFTELDAGKIIVLCWVMPCGSCVGPSKTTYAVVESFKTTNPNKVFMYLCDDVANTSCTSLNSWANSNSLTNAIRFSDAKIKMTDYGTTGMPKIVVVGSSNHKVYYNSNNTVNGTTLQTAINTAISESTVNEIEISENKSNINLFPNPSKSISNLNIYLEKTTAVEISIYNQVGQKVTNVFNGKLNAGENNLELNTSELSAGLYFININDSEGFKVIKLIVSK